MIRAAIFDMDGLLIDSEPLWQQAEAESFGAVGLSLSQQDLCRTVGMRIDEVVAHWLELRPWDTERHPPRRLCNRIIERLIELVEQRGEPMPGVASALALCQDLRLRLALASSSPMRIIEAVLDRLRMRERFEIVHSAELEARGTPDPAVFLTTASRLRVPPEECVALEDSIGGLRAARAAGMRCIMVPDPRLRDDAALAAADLVIDSLAELDAEGLRGLAGDVDETNGSIPS